MAETMRILLIEDDPDFAESVIAAIQARDIGACTRAASMQSALIAIELSTFDVVICDLVIPSVDGALDESLEYGEHVIHHLRTQLPGLPLIVFSAFGTMQRALELMRESPKGDFIGDGSERNVVNYYPKDQADDFLDQLATLSTALRATTVVEMRRAKESIELEPFEKRLLQIFARRVGGTGIRVTPLSGGLSGSKVLKIIVTDDVGATRAICVAKVASLSEIADESRRYAQFVAPILPNGSFAPLMSDLRAGGGGLGALFYGLEEDSPSLSSFYQADQQRAVASIWSVRTRVRKWTENFPVEEYLTADLRRLAVTDDQMQEIAVRFLEHLPWQEFENKTVKLRHARQHGDLHGENVLVGGSGPLLIDYGDVGVLPAGFDSITLELSTVFHPSTSTIRGEWPSIDNCRNWRDVGKFAEGCPFSDVIYACREWTSSEVPSDAAIDALAYSYVVRQLKYSDTAKGLAGALIEGLVRE